MAPIEGLLSRLINYYRKDIPAPPVISSLVAAELSVVFTLIYVIPFYLSEKTRPSPQLTRDAPAVIRARSTAVTFSAVLTTALTAWLIVRKAHFDPTDSLHLLGWWPIRLIDLLKTFLLVAILFMGPLFESAVCEGNWRDWVRLRGVGNTMSSSIGWRNYVTGPVTEEIVFRSVIIAVHILAKVSLTKLVFITPLYFGIAHVHHFYEFTLTHPQAPLLAGFIRSVVQFTYTSLFGFFAAFVYVRTGSIFACIIAHSFCNFMGLPRFWGRVEASTTIGPQDTARKDDVATPWREGTSIVQVADGRLEMQWTIAYYILLVLGAGLFYQNLWTLTESSNALVQFGKAL